MTTLPRPLARPALSRAKGRPLRLRAARVIAGAPGRIIPDGAALVDGDRILAVGPDHEVARPAGAEEIGFGDATLLPGLIDAHVHLSFAHGEDLVAAPQTTPEEASYRQARQAAARLLRAGVTTVRDLGCRGRIAQALRDAIVAGPDEGPRIVASGRPVTSPKGHLWSFGIEVRGVAEAEDAVRQLVAEEVDLVKLIATGGALTPGTPMGRAQFDRHEFLAVVSTAHAHRRRVAAHAHGTEGILGVVEAGVDTIEHCSWMDLDGAIGRPDEALLARMRDKGQMIVLAGPISPAILDDGRGTDIGEADRRRVERTLTFWRNARRAHELGIGIALGTDSLFGQFEDGHDLIYRAQALVRAAGWPAADVLAMMTSASARALGAVGEIGSLETGAFADLLVVAGDPLADIADLHRIQAVFLGGSQVAQGAAA